jgi:hypothetical protein
MCECMKDVRLLLSLSRDCCKAFIRICSLFSRSFSSPPLQICMRDECMYVLYVCMYVANDEMNTVSVMYLGFEGSEQLFPCER